MKIPNKHEKASNYTTKIGPTKGERQNGLRFRLHELTGGNDSNKSLEASVSASDKFNIKRGRKVKQTYNSAQRGVSLHDGGIGKLA